jgi:hypothetical protein
MKGISIMVALRKAIKNLIIIAVIMPLITVGMVFWHYGTEYAFSIIATYIMTIAAVFGVSRKIKEALHNLNVENDEGVKIDVEENNHKKTTEKH